MVGGGGGAGGGGAPNIFHSGLLKKPEKEKTSNDINVAT